MNNLSNREIKHLLDGEQVTYESIRPVIEERFKVFTRKEVGNANIRIDLISKTSDDDISLFRVLSRIYEYKELPSINIYLEGKIRWVKK